MPSRNLGDKFCDDKANNEACKFDKGDCCLSDSESKKYCTECLCKEKEESKTFIDCNCDGDGSLDGKCDDAGKCSCKRGFDGVKCNTCAKKFFGFPQCQGIFFSIVPKSFF